MTSMIQILSKIVEKTPWSEQSDVAG